MDFNAKYLTYQEYKAMGGTLDLTPFNLLEFEAEQEIDLRTQNRLTDETTIPQEVKICMFKLIETIENYQKSLVNKEKGLSSESIDGYSVSYGNGSTVSEAIKSKSTELDDMIMTYLYGVIVNGEHLIYLGAK